MEHSKGLFARLGLHGVSVSEIAEACKVSPAVLYQHFRSKEALYEEVINDLACEREDYVDAVLSGPSDFANVLYRMTVVFVKGRIRDADSVRIELRSLIDGNEIQEKFFSNHWKGLVEYIELSLQEMRESGTIESIDTRLAVLSYIALVRQVMITLSLDEQKTNGGAGVEYHVKGVLNIFLRGIELPALDW